MKVAQYDTHCLRPGWTDAGRWMSDVRNIAGDRAIDLDPRTVMVPPSPPSVYVVDDHPVIRSAVVHTLRRHGFDVVGQAARAETALREAADDAPDVAVVDLSLEDAHGLDLVKDLQARYPDVAVLVFSTYDESVYAQRAIRAGASGYVMKTEPPGVLVEAVRRVANGHLFLSDEMTETLLHRTVQAWTDSGPQGAEPDSEDGDEPGDDAGAVESSEPDRLRGPPSSEDLQALTDREMEVFQLLGEGHSLDAISDQLHVSRGAVDKYRRQAMHKLGCTSIHELLRLALRWTHRRAWRDVDP